MSIERVFLDWRQPGLPAAADLLAARAKPGPTLDLRDFIVALPGGRASRRLLELLVERAEIAGRGLLPPLLVTVGRLPELLYEAKLPFAEDFTQHLAWVEILKSIPPERLAPLLRQAPDANDLAGWLPLGEMLATLHRELAADRLAFRDILEHGGKVPGFDETARWELLVEIRRRYLELLDSLKLWDRQTARLVAIDQRECRTDKHIMLVGAVDLNQTLRAMLDQVAEPPESGQVTALVFAPEELSSRFDEHGCLVPEAWQEAVSEGVFERTEVVDGPGDQAAAVARALASFDGRYAAEEIVIGVPDESLVPWITQTLNECGLPVRYGVGTEIARTEPGRLLRTVAEFLERRTFAALSAVVRHPDLERLLKAAGAGDDWLTAFDKYYGEHLPFGVPDVDAAEFDGPLEMIAACRAILGLTDPLAGTSRSPGEWAAPIVELLLAVYGGRELDQREPHHRSIVVACEKIRDAADQHRRIPPELAPRVSGADAIGHVLDAIAADTVPPPAEAAAIELVGWLELPLDDAPALIVTGFNEGIVPSSLNADAFLPNELRRHLRLNDNARRYARDAYALSVLAHSRRELRIVAGRRTVDGDPLIPSRLLFACDDEELPQRVLKLLKPPAATPMRPVFAGSLVPGREQPAFEVPRPAPLKHTVESMRVTEFSDYLRCPYRYYLRQRLGLKAIDTTAEELDGLGFGSLLHGVLERFGKSDEIRSSTLPDEIAAFLEEVLEQVAQPLRWTTPQPALGVQIQQARLRLRAFAKWQAQWAAQGWRIICTEADIKDEHGAVLLVDGVPMTLRGRIDRIDVRETRSGLEFVLFDYKTGDAGQTPDQTHRKQGEWVDLQLPLYRHLVRALAQPTVDGPVQLGYILLPREARRAGGELAGWTASDLAEADRAAAQVVRQIRRQVFWPRSLEPVGDEFAAICQEQLLAAAVDAEAENGMTNVET